jgi:hypothetical protein
MRGTGLDEFRQTIQAGTDRLCAAAAEVVLMDAQSSRQTYAVIDFDRYESVLREVADANEVSRFHHHEIMRHWAESGLFDLMTADHDRPHVVAPRLYDSIGPSVGDFMTRGAHPRTGTPVASFRNHP